MKERRECSSLEEIVVNFFSGLYSFPFVGEINLTWDEQKHFLERTILHPLVQRYPMNKDYCKGFLKKIMKGLEKCSEYVHDDLYTSYCALMQSGQENDDYCFKHYLINDDLEHFITVKESPKLITHGTTGLRTWEAAIVLADWALSNKHYFKNKNVLELGSGLGMTGLVVAKYCGPSAMRFSDCHQRVLSLLEENIAINFPYLKRTTVNEEISRFEGLDQDYCSMSILNFDWNCVSDNVVEEVPDVLIGADIVYDPSTFEALCNVFDVTLQLNKDLKIFLVCTVRNEKTSQDFIGSLEHNKFSIKMLDYKHSSYIAWDNRQEYYVMEITKIIK